MNQKRDLTEKDWSIISRALDLYLRCQLGQMGNALDVFYWEFLKRTEENKELYQSSKEALIAQLRETLERVKKEICLAAFASTSASFGIRNLDDPVRQLIIQADLRCCNYADNLEKCPEYPTNCCAPTTGWCPKKQEKTFTLPHPSTDIKEGKYAVVGYHPELGGGILVWTKTKLCAQEDADVINKALGRAKVVTKKTALEQKKKEEK